MNTDYGQSSAGYGKLTESQAANVSANKAKIEDAKSSVGVSRATVAGVKLGSAELRERTSAMAPKISELKSEQGDKLTKTQKKILSNLQTDAGKLTKENKVIEKKLAALEKSAGKEISKLKIEENKISRSSKKVESYIGARKFGQTYPLFRTKKSDREIKSGQKEMAATAKASQANLTALNFNAKYKTADSEVTAQANKIKAFESIGREKLTLAKDVHTAIKDAGKQYDDLASKYENKKESFAKTQRKLSDSDKADIKDAMKNLKEQISSLKNLEKGLSSEKADLPKQRKELEAKQAEIKAKSGEITELIQSRLSEKMSFRERVTNRERVKNAVKDLFSSNSKSESDQLNAGELATLAKLFPGMDPKKAMEEYGRRFQESLNPGKTAGPTMSPSIEKHDDFPTDLPPQLEEDSSFPTDLPPQLEEDNSFPTDLPPQLEEDSSFPTDLPPQLEEDSSFPTDLPPQLEEDNSFPTDLPPEPPERN